MKNMIQEREEEYNRKHNELEAEVRSLMRMNENESATREYANRFVDEKNEFRQFKHDELSAFKDREVTIELVKDELMDENMALTESNNQLRIRVAELLGSRFHAGNDADNALVIKALREELRKAIWRSVDFKKLLKATRSSLRHSSTLRRQRQIVQEAIPVGLLWTWPCDQKEQFTETITPWREADDELGTSIMEQSSNQGHSTGFTISGASNKPSSESDCTYWQDSIICGIDFNANGYT